MRKTKEKRHGVIRKSRKLAAERTKYAEQNVSFAKWPDAHGDVEHRLLPD